MESVNAFVYFGTSAFSAAILQGLVDHGYKPELVVTTKGKPSKRGLKTSPTPVALLAVGYNLPLLEVSTLKSSEVLDQLKTHVTDFAVLAAFGKIVPAGVLEFYPKGIVNIHPSLLPHYRGPSPIQQALCDNAPETGVSLMLLDEEIDHGPVIAQSRMPILLSDDAQSLGEKLSQEAVSLLVGALPRYIDGELVPTPQDHAQATFTHMVERESAMADFTKTASELDCMRRAFTPWPGLWTTWQGKRLKLITTRVGSEGKSQSGHVEFTEGEIAISCRNSVLVVPKLQLESGKVQTAQEFVRGHNKLVGSVLPS